MVNSTADRRDQDFERNTSLHQDFENQNHRIRDRYARSRYGGMMIRDPDITGIGTKVCGANVLSRIVRKSPPLNRKGLNKDDFLVFNGFGPGRYSSMLSRHSNHVDLAPSKSSGFGGPCSADSDVFSLTGDSIDSKHSRSNKMSNRSSSDGRYRVPSLASSDSLTSAGMLEDRNGFSHPGSPDSSSTNTSEFSIPRVILQFDPNTQSGMIGYDAATLELASSSITPKIRNTHHSKNDQNRDGSSFTMQTIIDVLNEPKRQQPGEGQDVAMLQGDVIDSDDQEKPIIAPFTNFLNSFRSSPWTLSLPSVMEEPGTFDSEEVGSVTARSPKSYVSTNSIESDKARSEILDAMKQLVQKQQEIINELNNRNMKYEEQELHHRDDMKKLKDEKHEVQRRMIQLMVHQETFVSETEYLRAEIQTLRDAVRDMNITVEKEAIKSSSDIEADENVNLASSGIDQDYSMDDFNTSVSRIDRSVLSPANRSIISESSIPSLRDRLNQTNKRRKSTKKETTDGHVSPHFRSDKSSVQIDENIDNEWRMIAGALINKSIAETKAPNGPIAFSSTISASYQDELDADAFIQELGQEVAFEPGVSIDIRSYIQDHPLEYNDENTPSVDITTISSQGKHDDARHESLNTSVSSLVSADDMSSVLTADSKITATEVALFKSRLDTIHHRRIRRQRESDQHHKESNRKVKGPVVRFSSET